MKTKWTGTHLIFEFEDGDNIVLNTAQTKEFETWVKDRVNSTSN